MGRRNKAKARQPDEEEGEVATAATTATTKQLNEEEEVENKDKGEESDEEEREDERVGEDKQPKSMLVLTDTTNACDKCKEFLGRPLEVWDSESGGYRAYSHTVEHHQTRTALFKAVRAGCPLCFIIFRAILEHHKKKIEKYVRRNHPEYNWHATSYLVRKSGPQPESNPLSMKGRHIVVFPAGKSFISAGVRILELNYGTREPTPRPTHMLYYYSPRPSSLGPLDGFPSHDNSTASVDIQDWLSECLNNHDCEKDREIGFLPTRLLKCSNGCVRLIESQTINEADPQTSCYAALSYCWGPLPKHLRLTTNNIATLSEGLPLTSLSATFVDAFQIASRLGIEYLWIDSLCIIQEGDAGQDWLRQVNQMHKVYANCVLNIAAAHAPDADGGCFSERLHPTKYLQPPLPDLHLGEGKLPSGLAIEEERSFFTFPEEATKPFHEFKLNSRGWVFQERLLSPRTVHYDNHDVYWECSGKVASGYLPMGLTARYAYLESNLRPSFSFRLEPELKDETYPSGEHFAHWKRLVTGYSKRQLTRGEDRLIAFSSVSQGVCKQWKDDYIAGYCKALLPQALVWRRKSKNTESLGEPSSRIPSWSWGSLNEEVEFGSFFSHDNYDKHPICAEVLATDSTLVDESNKFGPSNFASITIQGPVFSWQVDELFYNTEYYPSTFEARAKSILYIPAFFCETENPSFIEATDGSFQYFKYNSDRNLDDDQIENLDSLVFLVIGYEEGKEGEIGEEGADGAGGKASWLEGIGLARLPGQGTKYSRVGYFDARLKVSNTYPLMEKVEIVTII